MDTTRPIQDQTLRLDNGVTGRPLRFASTTPRSFEDIIGRAPAPAVELHAALFVPPARAGAAPHPVVIIVPGSGGVLPPLLRHARALVDAGLAVLLVDPFGGRGVVHTVAEQRQIPFAASAYDVLAAMRALGAEPGIDTARMGAMGYSRGGLAVLASAMRVLAEPVLQGQAPLRAVLAGWPWCGYQFRDPDPGATTVRIVAADQDDYVSAVQAQALHALLRARGADVSLRIVRQARHGFGYGAPLRALPEAATALSAPIVYFDNDGVMLDPWSGERRPGLDDSAILAMLAPFSRRGVNVGSAEGQLQDFIDDFVAYFRGRLMK
ncbi:MAG: dienelactone hydrolase family protein [Aquabacterium sp.]